MDKKLKKEWVKALRSGDYQQGKNRLCTETKDGPKFCCLGVLCDIAFDETEAYWYKPSKGGWRFCKAKTKPSEIENSSYQDYSGGSANVLLPEWAKDELGLEHFEQEVLAEMNDKGTDFKELANYIEKNL